MKKLLLHWLVIAASLALVDYLLDGVRFTSIKALAIGAVALGLINVMVRPLLVLLTLPITIATLGLFYFVVNGLSFALVAYLVRGFVVSGLGTAILAALLTSIVSTILQAVFIDDD